VRSWVVDFHASILISDGSGSALDPVSHFLLPLDHYHHTNIRLFNRLPSSLAQLITPHWAMFVQADITLAYNSLIGIID
jgi:hypothetical protein